MERIGVIVGNGNLPIYFIKEAELKNICIYPIGLFSNVDDEIKKIENYKEFNIGEIEKIVKYLLSNDIKKIIMLGKIEKDILFSNLKLDKYAKKILETAHNKKDETLLFAIIAFLKLNGIKVLPQNFLLDKLMFTSKCYTNTKPSMEDEKTIEIGIEAAKALSKVDAGQTVICNDNMIISLEGIEGTDSTIKRAYKYSQNNIMIKMSRPQQDMRVDIPTIGINTLITAKENGIKGIVAESGKMLFLDQNECIKIANENNIFIIARKI